MQRSRRRKLGPGNDGKALEALVAQIEKLSLPPGVTVTCNRKIIDEDGDQLAEFDIYIKGKVGTVDLHWLFECRDRPAKRSAPRSWIEQLIGRRTAHELGKVVAVSTTPFSKGAVKLARKEDIETRTVSELTAEQVKDWITTFTFSTAKFYYKLTSVYLDPAPGSPTNAAAEIFKALREKRPDEKCIRYEGKLGHRLVSHIDVFLRFATPDATRVWGDLLDGSRREKTFIFVFSEYREAFFVDTAIGAIRLIAARCTVELRVEKTPVALASYKEYRGGGGQVIAQSATAKYTLEGSEVYMDFYSLTETGELIAIPRAKDE